MTFGFLPPHGRTLAAWQEFTVFGDIMSAVQGIDRVTSRRNIQALEGALLRGDLTIVNTPAPILEGPGGVSKMIALDSGNALTLQDAAWGASESMAV